MLSTSFRIQPKPKKPPALAPQARTQRAAPPSDKNGHAKAEWDSTNLPPATSALLSPSEITKGSAEATLEPTAELPSLLSGHEPERYKNMWPHSPNQSPLHLRNVFRDAFLPTIGIQNEKAKTIASAAPPMQKEGGPAEARSLNSTFSCSLCRACSHQNGIHQGWREAGQEAQPRAL